MAAQTSFAKGQLKSLVQRIERLEEERKTLGDDIREVYAEVKSAGFDTKVVRQVVRLKKMDQADRRQRAEERQHDQQLDGGEA